MTRITSLDLLNPDFRVLLDGLLAELAHHQLPMQVFESIRSPARQDELYAKGRDEKEPDFGRTVTRAKAYQSAHQFGLAVDIVFHPASGWTWDDLGWASFTRLAKAAGLETLSFEKPHVQIAGFDWHKLPRGPMDEPGWLAWLTAGAK